MMSLLSPQSSVLSPLLSEAVKLAVLRADDDAARGDGGRGGDGRAEVEVGDLATAVEVYDVTLQEYVRQLATL